MNQQSWRAEGRDRLWGPPAHHITLSACPPQGFHWNTIMNYEFLSKPISMQSTLEKKNFYHTGRQNSLARLVHHCTFCVFTYFTYILPAHSAYALRLREMKKAMLDFYASTWPMWSGCRTAQQLIQSQMKLKGLQKNPKCWKTELKV